jgi:uncharacterized Zn finger protein
MHITETKGSTVKVLGDSDVTYTVSVDGNGSARCSCPAFRFGKINWCKHLSFVYDELKGTPAS